MEFEPLNKNLYWSINDENHCIGDYSKYNIFIEEFVTNMPKIMFTLK